MIKTKQELLNHFSDINAMYNNPFMYQTLSNMIDELLEQQPCEDCISREAVMKCFKKWQPYMATRLLDYEQELIELPSVTPKALEQTDGDCISRKDTIEWLKKVTVTDGITFKAGFEQILYDIEQMPSVTPKAESENKE